MTARLKSLLPAVLIMAWAVTITLAEAAHLQVGAIALLLLSACSTTFWAAVFHWPLLVPLLFALSFLAALVVISWAPRWWAAFLDIGYVFLKEVLLLLKYNISMSATSETVLLYLIVGAAAFLFYALLIRTKRLRLTLAFMLPAGILFFAVYWYLYVDCAYWGLLLFAASWLWCWGWLRQRQLVNQWAGKAVQVPAQLPALWQRSLLVYILAILLVCMVLPKPAAFIRIPELEHRLLMAFPFMSQWRTPASDGDLFSIKVTGLQNDSELGGPVVFSDTELLQFINYSLTGTVYLKGSVKDTYRDNRWFKRDTASSPVKGEAGGTVVASIRHLNLHTRTLFVPAGQQVTVDYSSTAYRYHGGDFAAARPLQPGRSYLIRLADTDIADSNLQPYLQLPTDLPPRVSQLAESITRDYQDPFLKIKALEYYLRCNYEYSLRPPITPRGRDFVDYFLFDLEEGYCTYFATALAVMGRAVGIPTRYVEGLRIGEMEGRETVVTANQGHAWVEAYIPDRGWILLEPTPVYEYQQVELIPTSGTTTPWGHPDDHGYLNPDQLTPPRLSGEMPDNKPVAEAPNTHTEPVEQDAYRSYLLNLVGVTAAMLLLLLTNHYLRTRSYLNQLSSLPPTARMTELYKVVLKQLELLNLPRYPQETPLEYSQRILSDIYYSEANFTAITTAYTRVFYGGEQATTAEAAELERLVQLLENRLKARVGRLQFLRYKYLDFYGMLKNSSE